MAIIGRINWKLRGGVDVHDDWDITPEEIEQAIKDDTIIELAGIGPDDFLASDEDEFTWEPK